MQRHIINRKRFVRYKEGAEMYSMCQSKFEKMAKEANAVYKPVSYTHLVKAWQIRL